MVTNVPGVEGATVGMVVTGALVGLFVVGEAEGSPKVKNCFLVDSNHKYLAVDFFAKNKMYY